MQDKLSFIEVRGQRIHYRDIGVGPVVLFGHSYLWDLHMWDGVVSVLSGSFRCIVPDLAGHGQSSIDENFTLEGNAELMHEFLSAIGVKEFSIVGLSIGAMWGALLADKYAGSVKHLVLLNTSLTSEPPEKAALYQAMLQAVELSGTMPDEVIGVIVPGFFGLRTDLKVIDGFRQQLKEIPSKNIRTIVKVGRSFIERGDLLPSLLDYRGPVSVVAGEHDAYRSKSEAQQIGDHYKVDVEELSAGHISVLECETEVVNLLQNFLV